MKILTMKCPNLILGLLISLVILQNTAVARIADPVEKDIVSRAPVAAADEKRLFDLAMVQCADKAPDKNKLERLRRALQGLASANRPDLALRVAAQPAFRESYGETDEIHRITARVRALKGDLRSARSASLKIGSPDVQLDAVLAVLRAAIHRGNFSYAREVLQGAASLVSGNYERMAEERGLVGRMAFYAGDAQLAREIVSLAPPDDFLLETNDERLPIIEQTRLLVGLGTFPRAVDKKAPSAATGRRLHAVITLAWLPSPQSALAQVASEPNAFWRAVMLAELAMRQEAQSRGKGVTIANQLEKVLPFALQALESRSVKQFHIWEKDEDIDASAASKHGARVALAFFSVGKESTADKWLRNFDVAARKLDNSSTLTPTAAYGESETMIQLVERFYFSRLSDARKREVTRRVLEESGGVLKGFWSGSPYNAHRTLMKTQLQLGHKIAALETARKLVTRIENNQLQAPHVADAAVLLDAAFWARKMGEETLTQRARNKALELLAKVPVSERDDRLSKHGFTAEAAQLLMSQPEPEKSHDKFFWTGYYAGSIERPATAPQWIETISNPLYQMDALSGFFVGRALPQSPTLKEEEDERRKDGWGSATYFYLRSDAIDMGEWGIFKIVPEVSIPPKVAAQPRVKSRSR